MSLNHPNWNKSSSTALFRVENQIHNQNYSKFLHFLAQLNEEVNLKNEKKLISLSYLSKEKIIKLVFLFLHKSALIHLTEIYCHRHTLNRIGLFIYFVIQKKKTKHMVFCSFNERTNYFVVWIRQMVLNLSDQEINEYICLNAQIPTKK